MKKIIKLLLIVFLAKSSTFAQVSQSVNFAFQNLTNTEKIKLDREYEDYVPLSVNKEELAIILNNCANTGQVCSIIIGENNYNFLPSTNDNGKNYIGNLGGENNNIIINFESDNVNINIQDGNNCYSIFKDLSNIINKDNLYIKQRYNCNKYSNLNQLECLVGIETIVHTDNDFVSKFKNEDEAFEAIISTMTGTSSYYNEVARLSNSNGRVYFHDAFYEKNNSAHRFLIFNHGNEKIDKSDIKNYLSNWLNKNFPCIYNNDAVDLHLYFSVNVNKVTISATKPCGLAAAGVIYIPYGNFSRMEADLAHELGHYLGAKHTEDYLACATYCSNQNYLMCSAGPLNLNNAIMDECAWSAMINFTNTHCGCFSNNNILPECIHCSFDAYITQSNKPSTFVGCSNLSNEYDVNVFIQNDCIPKTDYKIFLQYSNGSNPSTYKTSVVDKGDFINAGTNPNFTALDYLESSPFNLAPEEKKSFKCRLKLDRVGSFSDYNLIISTSLQSYNFTVPVDHFAKIFETTTTRNNINKFRQDFPAYFFNAPECTLPEGTIHVKHDLLINSNHCLANNDIIIDAGKKIIVQPNIKLTISKARVFSCSGLWESIEVQDGATLEIVNSDVKQGNFAFDGKINSKVILKDNSKISQGNYGGKIKDGLNFELRGIQFEQLNGGVLADNTNMVLQNFEFNQIGSIGGPPNTTAPYDGNCITFLGLGSKLISSTFESGAGSFKNSNTGIYIDNAPHVLNGFKFSDINHGIYVKNTTGLTSWIHNNIMDVYSNGIFLDNNGSLNSWINNNQIYAKNNMATGIFMGGQTGSSTISRNLINMDAGHASIQISNCQNIDLKNNDANNDAATGSKSDCVYIVSSNNVSASCNVASHAGSGMGTNSIEIEESTNGNYKCNAALGADNGMAFIAYCNPSTISGNDIAIHDIGYVLSNQASGSDAITGPQYNYGNFLNGAGSSKDAWNYSNNLQSISQSQVRTSTQNNYIPFNIQELISKGWFREPEGQTEFSCESSNTCSNGYGRSSTKSEVIDKRLDLLYNDLDLGMYTAPRTWSARFATLMNIKSDHLLDEISLIWLNKFKATTLDILTDAAIILSKNNFQNSDLNKLQQEKKQLFTSNSILSDGILQKIQELDKNIQNMNLKLQKEFLSLVRFEKEIILNIETTNEFEDNMKQIMLLELEQALNPNINLSTNEKVKEIAELCPFSGGVAVYRARLLRQIVHSEYNDLLNCGERNHDLNKEEISPTIEVYPVPFTDFINIKINSISINEKFHFNIIDPQGKVFKSGVVSSQGQIQTTNLPSGIYFIRILEDPSLICKIIK